MAEDTIHEVEFQDLGAHALEAAGYAKAIQFIADSAHKAMPKVQGEMLAAMAIVAGELAHMADRIEDDIKAIGGGEHHE